MKTPPDDRVIGITLEELDQVDRVIALAGGKAKTEAIPHSTVALWGLYGSFLRNELSDRSRSKGRLTSGPA